METLCLILEERGRNRNMNGAADHLAQLEQAFKAAKAALEKELASATL
jgi:hypothetical protein